MEILIFLLNALFAFHSSAFWNIMCLIPPEILSLQGMVTTVMSGIKTSVHKKEEKLQ